MFYPKGHKEQLKLLTPELLKEKQELLAIAPIYGRKITDEYVKRAVLYNQECIKIGASLMQLVEKQC